jgi:hypothetical protein
VSVIFVVPAHGRTDLAAVCLTQLRRTCDALTDATAVVVADDENLDTAAALGFHVVEHPNTPLGAKWNAGYIAAADLGADYVIPIGSDDFVDHRLIEAQLEADGELRCSRLSAVVREDGKRLAVLRITYDGGDGVRVIPTGLLEPLGFRPCDDHRDRAMDTSMMLRLTAHLGRRPHMTYTDLHGAQIVDFKSSGAQLNTYAACSAAFGVDEASDPWVLLQDTYPVEAVAAVRDIYEAAGGDPLPTPAASPRPAPVLSIPITRDPDAFPREVARLRLHGPEEWV